MTCLTLILGGGRGTRLFPLTHMRSKPAVPLAGKYRLIDIPISNCLHAGLQRIFVLTQFNSASLNRHIAQTYRLDMFSEGFVEVLAAEQTPDSSAWFQGTADAVRQAARHFKGFDAEYFLILAGDHLYRMDFNELLESHIEGNADITIAAQPVSAEDATQMGILKFDDLGQIIRLRRKADSPNGSPRSAAAFPERLGRRRHDAREALRRVDGHLRVQPRGAARDARGARHRLRQGDHPERHFDARRQPVRIPRLLGRCRHDRLVLRRQHPADAARRASSTSFIRAGRSTRTRASCRRRASSTAISSRLSSPKAAISIGAPSRARSSASARGSAPAATSRDRSCSARTSTRRTRQRTPSRSASAAMSSSIASLSTRTRGSATASGSSTKSGVQHADGDGYYIRNGIIIVPKGARVSPERSCERVKVRPAACEAAFR